MNVFCRCITTARHQRQAAVLTRNLNQEQIITADKGTTETICVENFERPIFGQ